PIPLSHASETPIQGRNAANTPPHRAPLRLFTGHPRDDPFPGPRPPGPSLIPAHLPPQQEAKERAEQTPRLPSPPPSPTPLSTARTPPREAGPGEEAVSCQGTQVPCTEREEEGE